MQPLATFFQDQIARIRHDLISATPRQTFTAGPQEVVVFRPVPAHREPRRAYVVTPAEHGTLLRYRRGCKCGACALANYEYGRAWRAAHLPKGAA